MYRQAKLTNTTAKRINRAGVSIAPGQTKIASIRATYLREIAACVGLTVEFLDDHPDPYSAPAEISEETKASQEKRAKKLAAEERKAAKAAEPVEAPQGDDEAAATSPTPDAAGDAPAGDTQDTDDSGDTPPADDGEVTVKYLGNGWYEASDGRKFHGKAAVTKASLEVPA